MSKVISTSIAAVAALALSGGVYAQNNTLATPTTVSPATNATSGYGTPGATNSDSGVGTGSLNSRPQKSTNNGSTSDTPAYGTNNTLATPTTMSPAPK
ncbi:hypothetical protein [Paraburkholderia fungorum]|jgi:hypothetical protein|uniref:hypothetical protein n=1 Tax=Paraburkholderia fungorum TaxID=134537 RepID=UPI000484993F|nr:hypothetical protein [Paraburkholderia fungorum]MBB5540948.1 hypothetical protein [Paraburkholderia fungorum]PNE53706.1 hypothetical protein A8H39_34615 [Paraburkholderia fungorum]